MVLIAVFKKGVTRACNLTTYILDGISYNDYACPFCNLVLHSDFNLISAYTDRRCNCGGSVSINGQKTKAQSFEEQESNRKRSDEDSASDSTQQKEI